MPRSLATVRTILFDVGNTLIYVDTASIAGVVRELGYRADDTELREAEPEARAVLYRSSDGRDVDRWGVFLDALLGRVGLDRAAVSAVRSRLSEGRAASELWRRADDDAADVLAGLRARGFSLGVVSNSDGHVRRALSELRLDAFFDAVVDSQHVGVEKPHPRIFEIALQRLGRDAAGAVYVGDFYAVDVVGARRAGIEPVLLDPLELARDPDCRVIRSLADLLELLPERAGS